MTKNTGTIDKIVNETINGFEKIIVDVLSEYQLRTGIIVAQDETKYDGITDYDRKMITISEGLDEHDKRDTLIHEVLHVYFKNKGFTTSRAHKYITVCVPKILEKIYGVKQDEQDNKIIT